MLPSTFAALRMQGIGTEALRKASRFHLDGGRLFDVPGRTRFWEEFVACRRAFREAAGTDIEGVIANACQWTGQT